MVNDVLLNKTAAIRSCLKRIQAEYCGQKANLENLTKQESITLNLQRACELSIDLANHIVREKKLGIPQSSRDTFSLLENAGIIEAQLSSGLRNMVGFRNIAVHDYQKLSIMILEKILINNLSDFDKFIEAMLKLS